LRVVVSASVASIRRTVCATLASRERVVLAVSGGLDSMVLLDAAASEMDASRLAVATFDHGTGAAAAGACDLVERVAANLGIECVAGRASPGAAPRTEAAWRASRWAFLRGVARQRAAGVATAHTTDDQVETVLMRTLRGAGARGLAGLFAASAVLRPLLELRRATLLEYAKERRLKWVDDPSNESRLYLRNRVRHDILPALRRTNPAIDRELLDLSRRAAEWRNETETVAHVVSRVDDDKCAVDVGLRAIDGLDAEQLAVLWPAIAGRVGVALDRRGIGRIAAFSVRSRVGARIQLSGGWEVVRSRDVLRLQHTAVPSSDEAALRASAPTTWGDWTFWPGEAPGARGVDERGASGWRAMLPTDQPLRVRAWRPGDRLVGGAGPGRKVKRLLSGAGVTGHERTAWPVVLCGEQIVWIPGVRRSDAATLRSAEGNRPSLTFICARNSS
jgi:tRNA(Ile)-lysidine synthase